MKKLTAILSLLALAPAAWAQQATTTTTTNKPETKVAIPAHGTATATAGTKSTAITSEALLQRYGQASGEEAKTLLMKYHAQQDAMFQQRLAAYQQMQGKSEDEKRSIWSAMIEAQRAPMAEHRNLGKRLTEALKDEKEKGAAEELAAARSTTTPAVNPR